MAEKKFSLADQLFNQSKVEGFADRFLASDASFDRNGYVAQVMARLPELELLARAEWMAEVLNAHLPAQFDQAVNAILAMLPPPLDPNLSDDDFGDFIYLPLSFFVQRNGLSSEDLDTSLSALHALTQRFSCEFAIRHFLNAFPDETLKVMGDWAIDENYHVRRLVSEGLRPKLPWGVKIGVESDQVLPLLDQLHADKTRFVTRSVANHLNDISKTDPEKVFDCLTRWRAQGQQDTKELTWMTRHALRGLIKQGHPKAMELLGYVPDIPVTATVKAVPDTVAIGQSVELQAQITLPNGGPILVDYVIELLRADGSTGRKVGKWADKTVAAGKTIALKKAHKFVKNATTVTYHPGPQRITLQINGVVQAETRVTLTP